VEEVAVTRAGVLGFVAVVACGGPGSAPEVPRYEPAGQAKAQAAKSALRPLIIEWPAADRASLEAQRARGLAVVRYEEGEMELLRDCRAKGGYRYVAVTPKEEDVSIRNEDDLHAALPIHGARLEAALRDRKSLDVALLVVGTYTTGPGSFSAHDLEGDCARATHVVEALTVGAFVLSAQASSEKGASASFAGARAGLDSSASKAVLNRDGSRDACAKSGAGDTAPPFDCGALLRVEVVPISGIAAAVDPGRPPLLDVLKAGN
jgi:hypothetical protein